MLFENQIKRIQVVFNLADPFQELLYRHVVQQHNQSAYIKRLVQRDVEGRGDSNAKEQGK